MQAKEATHPVLRCYGGMPCDITAPYLRHIFDISSTLQHHICDITATYLRHYIDITATYLRHCSTISSTLQRHYSNISATLQHHIFDITATLQQHIFDITSTLQQHICDITAPYLRLSTMPRGDAVQACLFTTFCFPIFLDRIFLEFFPSMLLGTDGMCSDGMRTKVPDAPYLRTF